MAQAAEATERKLTGMCGGASSAQQQVQQQDLETMQQYDQMMKEQYANQQAIYTQVSSVLDPILRAGPGQKGFSQAEENDLNAQTVEGTAQNYAGAAKAVNEQVASLGGGNNPLPTGAQTQLKAQIAASAAGEQSREQAGVAEQNYATGRENFNNAVSGKMAIAAGENPLGYASATTNAEKVAGDQANTIAAQGDAWETALIGAAGSIGAGWATGGFKH